LKVSIYNQPLGSSQGIGGSELVAALLAESLAVGNQVDLFHRVPSLDLDLLAQNAGANLTGVNLRYVDSNGIPPQVSRNPLRHYQASREWLAELSKSYDLFIAIVHGVPPFSHAARSALIVLFPTPTAPYTKQEGGFSPEAFRHPAEWIYQSWEWKRRMATYQLKTAISDFSRQWVQRRWGIDCEVVHPPVNTQFRRVAKRQVILSVGRFAAKDEGHSKNQAEMIATFGELRSEGGAGWEYHCAGGLGDTSEHHKLFADLTRLADEKQATLVPNVGREDLKMMYEEAAIFWHAAGYGRDERTSPIFVEHFGISTVEAMAAGCVPVVINKGGQREIVEHGVSGFLWDTLAELKSYTAALIGDEQLRNQMSEAARRRAQVFSRDRFAAQFLARLIDRPQTAARASRPANEVSDARTL
jgi:glycosyltransferase involved in cell wall biosynthesis